MVFFAWHRIFDGGFLFLGRLFGRLDKSVSVLAGQALNDWPAYHKQIETLASRAVVGTVQVKSSNTTLRIVAGIFLIGNSVDGAGRLQAKAPAEDDATHWLLHPPVADFR